MRSMPWLAHHLPLGPLQDGSQCPGAIVGVHAEHMGIVLQPRAVRGVATNPGSHRQSQPGVRSTSAPISRPPCCDGERSTNAPAPGRFRYPTRPPAEAASTAFIITWSSIIFRSIPGSAIRPLRLRTICAQRHAPILPTQVIQRVVEACGH